MTCSTFKLNCRSNLINFKGLPENLVISNVGRFNCFTMLVNTIELAESNESLETTDTLGLCGTFFGSFLVTLPSSLFCLFSSSISSCSFFRCVWRSSSAPSLAAWACAVSSKYFFAAASTVVLLLFSAV